MPSTPSPLLPPRRRPSSRRSGIPALIAALALANAASAAGQQAPAALDAQEQAAAFTRRPAKEQEAIVTALRRELDARADPASVAVRAAIAAAAVAGTPRTKAFPRHEAGKQAPKAVAGQPEPLGRARYVFGLGAIETTPRLARQTKQVALAATRRELVHTALLGMLPDTDLAIAELERQLDRDTGADRFAAFLESWRNGDESFYEALDRTAGTADSVFFYDAMLGDFTAQFAATGDRALAGLQAQHDALHAAFLAYRQYRAFREALAWSLVLPPDLPLPAHLARYEAKVPGAYSLREQAILVLAVSAGDPREVVRRVVAGAPPLPQPLWQAPYDPYPQWNEVFAAALPTMIDRGGDTDAFLRQVLADRAATAAAIRSAARALLDRKAAAH